MKVCFFIALVVLIISVASYDVYRYVMRLKTLRKCLKFGEQLQKGVVKLFFNYKGKTIGVDSLGDFIIKQFFVNEENEEVSFLQDVNREVVTPDLAEGSKVPSRAYRVGIADVVANKEATPIAKIFLQPLSGCRDAWSVIDTDIIVEDPSKGKIHLVQLSHPIMGTLTYPKAFVEKEFTHSEVEVGQTIVLEQKAHRTVGNCWMLSYC